MPVSLFGKAPASRDPSHPDAAAIVEQFEQAIAVQDDLLYGIALFFEGLSVLHSGLEAVSQTERKQFRNIIQKGNESLERARALLKQARTDPEKTPLLLEFKFSGCQGHPQPEKLRERAKILVATYGQLFPDRPRSQPFTEEEVIRLIDAASGRLP